MARVPKFNKLDLRVEGGYTDGSTSRSVGGKFYYWELFYYHDLYTNKSDIIGSWIGREGVAYQAWSTYSFSPKNTLQFNFRHTKIDGDFVPGGETINDGSVKLSWWIKHTRNGWPRSWRRLPKRTGHRLWKLLFGHEAGPSETYSNYRAAHP
jgi:hypothetical protein